MPSLYSLVHYQHGPVSTFLTFREAARELRDVLQDEPGWINDIWIERFELVVAERSLG